MVQTQTAPLGRTLAPVIDEITGLATDYRSRSETIYRSLLTIVCELQTLIDDEQLGLVGLPPEWRIRDDR